MPHRHSTEVMLKFRMTFVMVKMWRSKNVGMEEGREGEDRQGDEQYVLEATEKSDQLYFRWRWIRVRRKF